MVGNPSTIVDDCLVLSDMLIEFVRAQSVFGTKISPSLMNRLVPAFVAVTAAAGAYLLGKSATTDRTAGKKNKKVNFLAPGSQRVTLLALPSPA